MHVNKMILLDCLSEMLKSSMKLVMAWILSSIQTLVPSRGEVYIDLDEDSVLYPKGKLKAVVTPDAETL